MNANYTVAIDMDGVIADFDALAAIATGMPLLNVSKAVLWKAIERYDRDIAPFFESLPLMPSAEKLIKYVTDTFIDTFILTASGKTPANVVDQKRRWANRYFPNMRVVVVGAAKNKAEYATPSTILIDDRAKAIEPWVAAGGIGILHVSIDDTIAALCPYAK